MSPFVRRAAPGQLLDFVVVGVTLAPDDVEHDVPPRRWVGPTHRSDDEQVVTGPKACDSEDVAVVDFLQGLFGDAEQLVCASEAQVPEVSFERAAASGSPRAR